MATLNLKIDEDDPEVQDVYGRYSDLKAFQVIRLYLNHPRELPIMQAIKPLHDMLPDRTEQGAETQHSNFSHTVLDVAQQIPYSHPAQGHLAKLLHYLQSSTKLNDRVIDKEDHWTFYAVMDQFHLVVGERSGVTFEACTEEEERVINTNAFLARLSSKGMFRAPSHAIWALRNTLEKPYSDQCYSGHIITASVWILYAGHWLFTEIVESPIEMDSWFERAWSAGSLYKGPVLGPTRWKFWQGALDVASKNEKASEDARKIARKAVTSMSAIEEAYQGDQGQETRQQEVQNEGAFELQSQAHDIQERQTQQDQACQTS